jgi:hypothetical protein
MKRREKDRRQETKDWEEETGRIMRDLQQHPGKAASDMMELEAVMPKNISTVFFVLILAAVIVSVDLLFFKKLFWERLMVNIGFVLVFAAFFLRFLKNQGV